MGVNQEEEAGTVVACAAVVCVDVTLLRIVVGHDMEGVRETHYDRLLLF
jgi:hypothetical protein